MIARFLHALNLAEEADVTTTQKLQADSQLYNYTPFFMYQKWQYLLDSSEPRASQRLMDLDLSLQLEHQSYSISSVEMSNLDQLLALLAH